MNEKLRFYGSVRTHIFAGGISFLEVSKDQISVWAPLGGRWKFSRKQVSKIEVMGKIRFIDRGVAIHHAIDGFPNPLVFIPFNNLGNISDGLEAFGFRVSDS